MCDKRARSDNTTVQYKYYSKLYLYSHKVNINTNLQLFMKPNYGRISFDYPCKLRELAALYHDSIQKAAK